jgi:hypothetical protein
VNWKDIHRLSTLFLEVTKGIFTTDVIWTLFPIYSSHHRVQHPVNQLLFYEFCLRSDWHLFSLTQHSCSLITLPKLFRLEAFVRKCLWYKVSWL